MDVIDNQTELDDLYGRMETTIDTSQQSQIFDFLRKAGTKAVHAGSNKQVRLARIIQEDTQVQKQIERAKTEKTIRRLRTQAVTTKVRSTAEEKLSGFLSEQQSEFRTLSQQIFTMNQEQIDSIEIDREFFGNKLANSLERAKEQRTSDLQEQT